MKEARLWELISLRLSNEASLEELTELDSLIKENPEQGFRIDMMSQVWLERNKQPDVTEDLFNKHLQRLSNHFTSPALRYEDTDSQFEPTRKAKGSKMGMRLWTSVAAAIILICMLVYLLDTPKKISGFNQNIVATKPGSKSKLTLPDGTQVWLNSDSKITYDEKFGNDTREVLLSGEAYFDVVKDKSKPFIIHSKNMDIKVLGTAFNVRAYPDEKTSETSLIRGVIEVTLKSNPDKKIILKPNEKLVIQDKPEATTDRRKEIAETGKDPILTLSNVRHLNGDSTSVETSWIKNKLAFDGESFELVAKKIEKWYGVTIIIKGPELKDVEFTGLFEDETLSEVMDALKMTGSFKYKINRRDVTVEP